VYWQLIKLSARNLFRNKRRTFITGSILILGSVGMVLVGGFFEGLLFMLREGYIRAGTGHIQIHKSGYSIKGSIQPFEYLVENFSELNKKLRKTPDITYIFPEIRFGGMLANDENSMPVLVMGVDPDTEADIFKSHYYGKDKKWFAIAEGDMLDADDPNGILIGKELQKALGVKVGDPVYFITTQKMGSIEGAEFRIRGIFAAGIKDLSAHLIRVPLSTAQKIWAVPDQVHSVNLHLSTTENTYDILHQIEKLPELKNWDLEWIPWDKQDTVYMQTELFLRSIYLVLTIIVGVIMFFSIANTINMNLLERIKEYGTMMAIGCNRSTVFSVILTEAVMVGFVGGMVGLATSIFVAKILSNLGIHIPPPPLVPSDHALPLYILWNPMLLFQSFAVCFSSAILAAIFPAVRAIRFRIVQALGYV
jgi:putative ABC transport system permease protein